MCWLAGIDFTCVEQNDLAPGIAMLPLYTAICGRFVHYDHPQYHDRGWTRAERCIFAAFNKPQVTVLCEADGLLDTSGAAAVESEPEPEPDEEDDDQLPRLWSLRGKHRRVREVDGLHDPIQGGFTDPSDRVLIAKLVDLAKRNWGKSWRGTMADWAGNGLRGLETLGFGARGVAAPMQTQVLVDRVMVRGSMRRLQA